MSGDLGGFSLMELFREESAQHLAVLSAGLLALEAGPVDAAAVESLMRAAHSLKGAARIVGLEPAVSLAHVMEDCFVGVQEQTITLGACEVDRLLQGLDLLSEVSDLQEGKSGAWLLENEERHTAIIEALRDVAAGRPVPPMPERRGAVPFAQTETPVVQPVGCDEELPWTELKPKATAQPGSSGDDLTSFSLLELFQAEAEAHANVLSNGLLALEATRSLAPADIEPLMRAAHSLKGAARIVELDLAVVLAHAMEDVFVAAQCGQLPVENLPIDLLLGAVDALTALAAHHGSSSVECPAQVSVDAVALTERLRACLTDSVSPARRESPPQSAAPTLVRPQAEEPPGAETARCGPIPGPNPPPPSSIPRPSEPGTSAPSAELGTAVAVEANERVVRVTAESMTRLMGLAGESLVQSKQLRPFVDSLLTLRTQVSSLQTNLQSLHDRSEAASAGSVVPVQELLARLRQQATAFSQSLTETVEDFEDFARRGEDLAGRLHQEVLTSRMRPLVEGVRGFPRLVRDIARQLGKSVRYELVGENTGVDRDILDKLEAPLNHLIRNALDHAIEPPEERRAAGKPTMGRIRLEGRHRAGMLHITLTDDGRGIDPQRLRAKVVQKGLATTAMAGRLSDAELLEFLFLPGFSTKDSVTELSGRGVGLDVVQDMVRTVGGVVRVSSTLGQGTRFTLQLPISMSVVRALLVQISGEPYAFPLNRIDRILTLDPAEMRTLEGREHFLLDGQPVALVEACQVLERPPAPRRGPGLPVVVASDRSHRFGVIVEEFLGERDLEVRPLDPRLGKVPNLSSASILEDGWPVLIVDVEDLVQSVDNLLAGRRMRRVAAPVVAEKPTKPRSVLVVDDSLTVRELERQLLENHGYLVEIAVDGVDGWNAARMGDYDLIISDVDMPRMDGIGLVTRIKSDPRLRTTPVVIVSYKDREEDRMRGLDAGANAYLTKSSFHDQTFLRTVVDLIGEAQG